MSLKCPSCENQVAISEAVKKELDRKDLEIQKLKSNLWDYRLSFKVYKKITENAAETQARETTEQDHLFMREILALRTENHEIRQATKRKLAQAKVLNRKGTPGYGVWLGKFRAAQATA